MESTAKTDKETKEKEETIELKIKKESLNKEDYSAFLCKLDTFNIKRNKDKSSKYVTIQLPIEFIFYIESLDNGVRFHIKAMDIELLDSSDTPIKKILDNMWKGKKASWKVWK